MFALVSETNQAIGWVDDIDPLVEILTRRDQVDEAVLRVRQNCNMGMNGELNRKPL